MNLKTTPLAEKLQRYFLGNWASLVGIALVLIALIGGLFLVGLKVLAGKDFAYIALLYLGLAAQMLVGILLAIGGAWSERRRIKLGLPRRSMALLTLDLSKPKHQITALTSAVVAFVVLGVLSSGTYLGLHYVESDEFCTQACHSVMRPEGEAKAHSAHAKVPCVDCHVGEGAGSFVQAKLNGLRQVKGVILGDFNRPIQTPIHNMRPARETCESCHWRDRWIGYKEREMNYYSAREDENTLRTIRMLVKVGGRKGASEEGEGIHFHMMLGRSVEFIARDRQRQNIAWVRVTEKDGTVKEFNHSEKPLTDEERAKLPKREMECLDCHNRPAHQYKAPMPLMNAAMADGLVDPKLPAIKRMGVEVLSAEYATTEEAVEKIAADLRAFYEEEFEEVLTDQKDSFEKSVAAIQNLYRTNFFPEMKVRWSAYPDNIGHRDSQGCFRCHNDQLVNEDDEPIFTDCKGCHIVLTQGSEIAKIEQDMSQGLAFFHPDDEDYIKEYNDCGECHTGGADTYDE